MPSGRAHADALRNVERAASSSSHSRSSSSGSSSSEIYAGYDHTAYLGNDASAPLGGPLLGVRTWF